MGKQKQWRTDARKINLEMGSKHNGRKFKNDPRMARVLEKIIQDNLNAKLLEKVETPTAF